MHPPRGGGSAASASVVGASAAGPAASRAGAVVAGGASTRAWQRSQQGVPDGCKLALTSTESGAQAHHKYSEGIAQAVKGTCPRTDGFGTMQKQEQWPAPRGKAERPARGGGHRIRAKAARGEGRGEEEKKVGRNWGQGQAGVGNQPGAEGRPRRERKGKIRKRDGKKLKAARGRRWSSGPRRSCVPVRKHESV